MLEDDDMPVYDAPDDDAAGSPRQSYNFAPGYHGIVYRADVPDWGAGPAREHGSGVKSKGKGKNSREAAQTDVVAHADDTHGDETAEGVESNPQETDPRTTTAGEAVEDQRPSVALGKQGAETHYILQSMKWGLVPFWTKRNPDYRSMLKTINCRDDSLAQAGGMWATMKARKRCIVVAQGFYEWLKPKAGGDKVPHFVKRADGKLMCFAGLWDCVRYDDDAGEGEENRGLYTYTVITTDSNEQLRFLHDRMPVIMDQGSDALRTWLDPGRYEWSKELQSLLKPYTGKLEVYPVTREVGKVGNNSPNFIIPVASKENKRNIANFFANAGSSPKKKVKDEDDVKKEEETEEPRTGFAEEGTARTTVDEPTGLKREASSPPPKGELPPVKKGPAAPTSATASKSASTNRPKFSATRNVGQSPRKAKNKGNKAEGSQKITKFFSNSS
jgi:putative SOS response-associated peptidase YedK